MRSQGKSYTIPGSSLATKFLSTTRSRWSLKHTKSTVQQSHNQKASSLTEAQRSRRRAKSLVMIVFLHDLHVLVKLFFVQSQATPGIETLFSFLSTTRSRSSLKDTKSTKKIASGGSPRASSQLSRGQALKSWVGLRQGFARHANGLGLGTNNVA